MFMAKKVKKAAKKSAPKKSANKSAKGTKKGVKNAPAKPIKPQLPASQESGEIVKYTRSEKNLMRSELAAKLKAEKDPQKRTTLRREYAPKFKY